MQTQYEAIAGAEETVRKLIAAFNSHDMETVNAGLAQDIVADWNFLPNPLRGREAVVTALGGYLKAFPDIRVNTKTLLSKGDTVVHEYSWSGTHGGPLEGPTGPIPPTNRRVDMKGAELLRFNSRGQISEWRAYEDFATFAKQLGLAQ